VEFNGIKKGKKRRAVGKTFSLKGERFLKTRKGDRRGYDVSIIEERALVRKRANRKGIVPSCWE